MVSHFVAAFSADMKRDIRQVTPGAMELLEREILAGLGYTDPYVET